MKPRVTVVMATDVGRSPRAALHVQALAAHDLHVTVIGSAGRPTPLSDVDNVEVVRLPLAPPAAGAPGPARWALHAAQRFGRFGVALARALHASRPDVIVAVAPPSTPVLDLVALVARARRVPFVVDWHNLETAMVALRLASRATAPAHGAPRVAGSTSPPAPLHEWRGERDARRIEGALARAAVAAAARHELVVARGAALHLGVTDALVAHLQAGGLPASRCVAFADAPSTRPPPRDADFFAARGAARAARGLPSGDLLVMASSYSIDDDVDFLVDALAAAAAARRGLHLLLTGDGPRRAETVARLSAVAGLAVSARYVDDDDFLPTLGLCDVALSAHRSASGLDFPYKVRDAAAAGIPTVALDTGAVLRAGLAPHDVAAATPAACAAAVLALLADPPRVHVDETWRERWDRIVWPRVAQLLGGASVSAR